MVNKEFNLEKHIDNWILDADDLAVQFGYRAVGLEGNKIVVTTPKRIKLGEGVFVGEFDYDGDDLWRVILTPIIDGVQDPGYPSKQYEAEKYNYCVNVLHKKYGDKLKSTENGVSYMTEKYSVECFVIKDGRNQYTGGDIIISMI